MKQFLREHPLISISGLEREVGMPAGTIRLTTDRKIPKKYRKKVIDILSEYGYKQLNLTLDTKKEIHIHIHNK